MKLKLDDQGHVVLSDGKPVYVHDDGKEIAFDGAQAFAKIGQLTSENKAHRTRAEELDGKVKLFEGIEDPDAAKRALETVKNIKDGDLIAAGKVEEIKAAAKKAAEEQVEAANKQFLADLTKTKTERDTLQQQLYDERIGGSFDRSKFIAEKLAIPGDLARAAFGKAFKIEEGKVVAYDANGNKLFSRERPGDIANFDEALETLVEHYPHRDQILKGSGASGSGANGGGGGGSGSKALTRDAFAALPPDKQMAHVKGGGTISD